MDARARPGHAAEPVAPERRGAEEGIPREAESRPDAFEMAQRLERLDRAQTFRALGAAARAVLAAASETPALDADLLLAAVAHAARSTVLAHPERVLAADDVRRFRSLVARRAEGVPLAYLLGRRDFYSLTLEVDDAVLVPRPETELLVEQTLEAGDQVPSAGGAVPSLRVLDLGTGSGAIALALTAARPSWTVTAADKSRRALAVARANGHRLGLGVEWLESDWFGALGGRRFDLIVCNPPYVATRDCIGALRFEPRLALDGGADGLDAIRALLAGARDHLEPAGRLLLEHGADQRGDVLALAAAHGLDAVDVHSDLAGRDRCVVLNAAAGPASRRAGSRRRPLPRT